uniref:Uncharacterized protein n=1 Tax=Cannabis sativa TaxID=3483 RepID=A0A803NMA8_CANSA
MAQPHKRIENSLVELEKSKEKRSPVPRTRSRSPRPRSSKRYSPRHSPRRRNPTWHRSPNLAVTSQEGEFPKAEGRKLPPITGNRDKRDSKKLAPCNILTIISGSHISGDSKKVQERYAKEVKEKPLTTVNNLSKIPTKLFKKECENVTFMESDERWVHHPHTNALVIAADIRGDNVHHILVDNDSYINLLNLQGFKQMGLHKKGLKPITLSIYRFTVDTIELKGESKEGESNNVEVKYKSPSYSNKKRKWNGKDNSSGKPKPKGKKTKASPKFKDKKGKRQVFLLWRDGTLEENL